MKTRTFIALIFLIAVLSTAGCKAAEPKTTDSSMETSYPSGADYPVDEIMVNSVEEAYPISQQNLNLLFRTWTLSTYKINDQDEAVPMKTLTFLEDGSYVMATEAGTTNGYWQADISMFPTLILKSDSDQIISYSLLSLGNSDLSLQLIEDGNVIDEQYLPVD